MDPINIILDVAILVAVGSVGLLVKRVLNDVEDLKKFYTRIAEMEVKVDTLWGEHTDSGYTGHRKRETDYPRFQK